MLRQRVVTALVLGMFVLFGIFLLPAQAISVAIAALILAGAWEWSGFLGLKQGLTRLAYLLVIAIGMAMMGWVGAGSPRLDDVMVAAGIWWLVALVWVRFSPLAINPGSTALAGLLVLLPAWLALVRLHALGSQVLLFLLLLVVAADIGAYFVGRRFGRRKLAPQVSPSKTWEGVLGGLAGALLLAGLGVWWFRVSLVPFICVCLLGVAASIIGDLTESMFKRHAGLKDSGTLLPGHGGVLDRIDSLTAAAPVFLLAVERLGWWR